MNIKVKSIVIFIGLITLLTSFASSTTYATDVTLDVPEIEQEHSQWCWAGVSESVLAYYGETASQCDIADWAWSRSDCCTGSLYDWNHDCNQTNSMYSTSVSIRNILDNWGVGPDAIAVSDRLTWKEVVSEIDEGKPFIMRFGWTSGGGHFLTGYGYDDGFYNFVLYMDPAPGAGYTKSTYAHTVSSSDHDWTHTLYNLEDGQVSPESYTLTVTTSGSGSVSPTGGTYNAGTSVTLTATPYSGWAFAGWSGDASGASNTIQVAMNSDMSVVATFSETGQDTLTYQAEEATFSNAVVESEHSGYTGSGYLNFDNETGSSMALTVTAASSANADLTFRFANGASSARPMNVEVNGSTQISSLSFAATGAWTNWSETTATVYLSSGSNTIELVSSASDGGPNMDKITVTGDFTSSPAPTPTPTPTPTPSSCAVPSSISVPSTSSTGNYTVSWGASDTSAVSYVLQEATNASFSSGLRTAYSGTDTSTGIVSSRGKTYYYRVKATKTGYSDSAWRTGSNGCQVSSGGCN